MQSTCLPLPWHNVSMEGNVQMLLCGGRGHLSFNLLLLIITLTTYQVDWHYLFVHLFIYSFLRSFIHSLINGSCLLCSGRAHHVRRYADTSCPHCLLCSSRSSSVRHTLAKSRTGHAGFVDISFQHQTDELLPNGFIPNSVVGGRSADGSPTAGLSPQGAGGNCRFPHVVGYYEVDSKKIYPKDVKKSNLSVEQLRVGNDCFFLFLKLNCYCSVPINYSVNLGVILGKMTLIISRFSGKKNFM